MLSPWFFGPEVPHIVRTALLPPSTSFPYLNPQILLAADLKKVLSDDIYGPMFLQALFLSVSGFLAAAALAGLSFSLLSPPSYPILLFFLSPSLSPYIPPCSWFPH
jgi:hypothetical protein